MPQITYKSQLDYLNRFCKNSDPLIAEMKIYAEEKKVPILDENSIEFLEMLVKINNPKRVLEIGTAIAYSSIRIACCLGKGAVIDTIEKSGDNLILAEKNISKSGLDSKINLIFGDAIQIMPGLAKNYDLIFLDADKEDYETLYELSLDVLVKGGVLFVDNLLWHGYAASTKIPLKYKNSTRQIRKFNEIFMSDSRISSSLFPIGDGVGVAIKL